MKLLLMLVTVIAVSAVEGRDITDVSQAQTILQDIGIQSEDVGIQGEEQDRSIVTAVEGRDFTDVDQAQIILQDIGIQGEEKDLTILDASDRITNVKDSLQDDDQMMEEEQELHQRNHRKSRCKARDACVVMGGFCVINATLCDGRLVPEWCKGTNCQCCVPGTIEARFDHLEMLLQSLKDNITNNNEAVNLEIQSLKDNINKSDTNMNSELEYLKDSMTNVNSSINTEMHSIKINMNTSDINLGSELQYLKDNTNNMNTNLNSKLNSMNSNLNTKLASLEENQGCPDGLFKLTASNQCFKVMTDTRRTYTAAKSKCHSEGLVLARPYDPIALARYIAIRYGNKQVWLGARGTGSYITWERDGTHISSSNPMWYSNHPSGRTSSSYCLELLSAEHNLKNEPTTPLYSNSCTNTGQYALCEHIID